MQHDIVEYHNKLTDEDRQICDKLYEIISKSLPQAENKVWHAHPVWFIDGNPIVGYSKLKDSIQLLFWSGQSFNESELLPEGSFKAAGVRYTSPAEVNSEIVTRYLKKAVTIQWDYKNLVKKHTLIRLK